MESTILKLLPSVNRNSAAGGRGPRRKPVSLKTPLLAGGQ